MSGATIKTAYAPIDIHADSASAWPAEIPELTGPEASRAARRLWRFAMGKTFEGKVELTSGNRYTSTFWPRDSNTIALRVNPTKGWRELIHDLSHLFVSRANPDERPHSKFHAAFEAKLVREVIKRGWLDGRLRDAEPVAPSIDDKRQLKLQRTDEALLRWERKRMRAVRAMAKLQKQRRYLEKALAS